MSFVPGGMQEEERRARFLELRLQIALRASPNGEDLRLRVQMASPGRTAVSRSPLAPGGSSLGANI